MKILKFSSSWCSPCTALKKQLENYTKHQIIEFDFDTHTDKFEEFNIKSMPTLVVLDNDNNEVARHKGMMSLSVFEEWVNTITNGTLEVR